MIDEEIAEEYICNGKCQDDIDRNYVHCKTCTRPDDFLAGLEAGRPKWHKVVDGDLPKENNLYLVAIKDNGLAIAYFNGLHWETKFNLGDFGHCLETVIAWCEIPKFEEK